MARPIWTAGILHQYRGQANKSEFRFVFFVSARFVRQSRKTETITIKQIGNVSIHFRISIGRTS